MCNLMLHTVQILGNADLAGIDILLLLLQHISHPRTHHFSLLILHRCSALQGTQPGQTIHTLMNVPFGGNIKLLKLQLPQSSLTAIAETRWRAGSSGYTCIPPEHEMHACEARQGLEQTFRSSVTSA